METKGLLFIPDISGFTRFVTESEINHSRVIIQELLELLINANQMGLEISEIEGDAILFYKFGEPPQLKELYQQVAQMFSSSTKILWLMIKGVLPVQSLYLSGQPFLKSHHALW